MIYGSTKIALRKLSENETKQLMLIADMSRKLYNLCTNTICTHYEHTGKVLTYQALKPLVVDKPEYRAMTGWYYQTLISAISDFKKYISTSIYSLNKSDRTLSVKNLENYIPPHPKKEMRQIEIGRPLIHDGYLTIPRTCDTAEIKIKIPECYRHKNIFTATIKPLYHARYWELILTYQEKEIPHANLSHERILGIDLGITNFATCAAYFFDTHEIDTFIVDGRCLKNVLQGYCKYRAKLQAAHPSSANTRRLCSLSNKTHHRVEDYVAKTASYIIKYCIRNRISKIVLGWGVHFQTIKIGINNQLYALFPFAKVKTALQYQCSKHGIEFCTVDECFTSQASFIDNDVMPDYVTRDKQYFSGKRIKRGEYMSKNGWILNADVNGALNIIRKSLKCNVNMSKFARLDVRGLAFPKRITPLK